MTWFWLVIFYSFGGYLLEKGYAAAVRSPHRVRKCFLLLPLCPVYGLYQDFIGDPGMFFILCIPSAILLVAAKYFLL